MDLRQLRYFVTIAETQSLSKAGERLHIAQPALSLQLASLEDELSTRLFDRRSRGVTLTENGAILLRHAMHILQSVNNAVSELKTQDISIAGRVVIGFTGTVAAVVATRTIRQVRRKYPNVLLTVMESSIRRLVEQLERDELDLAIVVNELDRTSINVQAVAMEDFCLYGARDASDGTTSDGGGAGLTGYSILNADSLADAAEKAKGCPILASGGTVEVYETFDVM